MIRALIPELVLPDTKAGEAHPQRVFGFSREGGRMVLGSQAVLLTQGPSDGRHGRIDHIALAVPEVGEALEECLARGGQLSDATPEGPLAIPEFWENGVDYVFLDSPEGAKVELIARRPPGRPGWPGGTTRSEFPAPSSRRCATSSWTSA